MRRALGAIRQGIISAINRREFVLPDAVPTVSFTFDDFPRSALVVGGTILKSYGACATYYAAMGLMNQANDMGEQFCAEDLGALFGAGHELGSHTFRHLSCRSAALPEFETDMQKGKEAVEAFIGNETPHQFSYPYGHATLYAKRSVGSAFSSCRGIFPGVNESPVDLNLLRANRLYSESFDLDSIDRLLQWNEKRRGWLIFYTHDVSDKPSSFGCRPSEFDSVVKRTVQRRNRILSVGGLISSAPDPGSTRNGRSRYRGDAAAGESPEG